MQVTARKRVRLRQRGFASHLSRPESERQSWSKRSELRVFAICYLLSKVPASRKLSILWDLFLWIDSDGPERICAPICLDPHSSESSRLWVKVCIESVGICKSRAGCGV